MRTIEERILRAINRRYPNGLKGDAMDSYPIATNESFVARPRISRFERLLRMTMAPVDEAETQKALEAGDRVVGHLTSVIQNVEYRYQGSIVANTHIKGASDIDLLVINTCSFGWNSQDVKLLWRRYESTPFGNQKPYVMLKNLIDARSYGGDAKSDLAKQCRKCEERLCSVYTDVDLDGSKAVRVLNKSLDQKIDVVNCTWFHNATSVLHEKKLPYSGIRIYNRKKNCWEKEDYPFLKIALMDARDHDTGGRFKQIVRFFKTLRSDADKSDSMSLSSYDIYSLVYAIDPARYSKFNEVKLAGMLLSWLMTIAANGSMAQIKGIGEDSNIFAGFPEKLIDVRMIADDLNNLLTAYHGVRI